MCMQAFAAGQQYAQQFAQHHANTAQHLLQQPQGQQGYAAQPLQQASAQPEQLRAFWQQQMLEVEQTSADPSEFKNQQLPLARIKKVGLTQPGLLSFVG